MPLNEREEQEFRQIALRLSSEDPGLTERMGRLSERLAGAGALTLWVLVVLGGLALLPLAAETGIYLVGIAGYGLAALGAVRGYRALRHSSWLPHPLALAAARRTGGQARFRIGGWWKVTLGVAVGVAVFMIASGPPNPTVPAVQPAVAETSGTGSGPLTTGLTRSIARSQ